MNENGNPTSKIVVKAAKVLGGVALALVALLAILPYFLKDKIKDIALSAASESLNAELYLDNFDLSFFQNFPNATIIAENFKLVSLVDPQQRDTMASVGELAVTVNLSSIISGNYEVSRVSLSNTLADLKVLADGRANWDIVKVDSSEIEMADADTSASAFNFDLRKVTIENLSCTYTDMQSQMRAAVDSLNLTMRGRLSLDDKTLVGLDEFELAVASLCYRDSSSVEAGVRDIRLDMSGDLSDAVSDIKAKLGAAKVGVKMGAVPYLKDAELKADIAVKADLENNRFDLAENTISLNELKASVEGFVQMVDSTINMDLNLVTPDIDFKQILSLIPAIYSDDFASIQTSGKVKLSAWAKGTMAGDLLPAYKAEIMVSDAMFKYPDLPSQVDGISVVANVKSPGGVLDNTVVDVEKLKFVMAGNPFAMNMSLRTPISDPDFNLVTMGVIDFSKLTQVVHIPDTKFQGKLAADLKASGRLSYVDKEQYDRFVVAGKLQLFDFVMSAKDMDYDVNITKADMAFSTQKVDLTADLKLGKSDVNLSGKLSHFIQYLLRGEEIVGSLDVKSNYIDANQLIGAEATSEDETPDTQTQSSGSFSVPSNINFNMNVSFAKILYQTITIEDLAGNISLKNAIASLNNLRAQSMGGKFTADGAFNAQDSLLPKLDAAVAISQMDVNEVFTKVRSANKLVPLFSDASGKFDMNITLSTNMNAADLSPVLSTVNAKGKFKSSDLGIKNLPALSTIAEKVNFPAFKNPNLKDIDVAFKIVDGKLAIDPFETVVSNSIVNFSGWSSLDKTLAYVAKITLPEAIKGKAEKIVGDLAFDVNIGGSFAQPKVTVSAASMVDNAKKKVEEKVEEVKEKVSAEIEAQKQKLIEEAKKQKDKVMQEAQNAGGKLVSEARKQSTKLQSEAKNPIEKAAKKKAAEALVKKAVQDSTNLVNKAQEQGDKLINEAKSKAATLK